MSSLPAAPGSQSPSPSKRAPPPGKPPAAPGSQSPSPSKRAPPPGKPPARRAPPPGKPPAAPGRQSPPPARRVPSPPSKRPPPARRAPASINQGTQSQSQLQLNIMNINQSKRNILACNNKTALTEAVNEYEIKNQEQMTPDEVKQATEQWLKKLGFLKQNQVNVAMSYYEGYSFSKGPIEFKNMDDNDLVKMMGDMDLTDDAITQFREALASIDLDIFDGSKAAIEIILSSLKLRLRNLVMNNQNLVMNNQNLYLTIEAHPNESKQSIRACNNITVLVKAITKYTIKRTEETEAIKKQRLSVIISDLMRQLKRLKESPAYTNIKHEFMNLIPVEMNKKLKNISSTDLNTLAALFNCNIINNKNKLKTNIIKKVQLKMFDSDYSRIIKDTDSSIISYINRNQELKKSIGINALSENIIDNKTRLIAQRKLENLIKEAKLKEAEAEAEAATIIQARARGIKNRNTIKKQGAATIIQARARGIKNRTTIKKQKEAEIKQKEAEIKQKRNNIRQRMIEKLKNRGVYGKAVESIQKMKTVNDKWNQAKEQYTQATKNYEQIGINTQQQHNQAKEQYNQATNNYEQIGINTQNQYSQIERQYNQKTTEYKQATDRYHEAEEEYRQAEEESNQVEENTNNTPSSGGKKAKRKPAKRKPAKRKPAKRKPAKRKPAKRKPTGKKKVRKIHKGPRGGRYYISKGRKVYL